MTWIDMSNYKLCNYAPGISTLWASISSAVGRERDPTSLLLDDGDVEWDTSVAPAAEWMFFPFKTNILK